MNEREISVVYERYSSSLFRFIYRFTANREASEEILHDVFAQLIAGKFTATENGTLQSWLFTLAKNRCLNHLRSRAHERRDDVSPTTEADSPESQVIERNLLLRLETVEAGLPADLRQTWILRKQGLDYQQIARHLAIPVGTVKSRFSRLLECLKEEFIGDDRNEKKSRP